MLNLFKKKFSEEDIGNKEDKMKKEEKISAEYDKKISKEIVIFTMPEKFRLNNPEGNQAKIIGLVIIVGGIIFAIAASFLAYYFLFKADSKPESLPQEEIYENNIDELESLENDMEDEETPNLDNDLSDDNEEINLEEESLATTTPEDNEIATTTPEIEEATSTPLVVDLAMDSDNDGLSDREEEIFNCDMNNEDSDRDGYSDLEEVLNLYNPVGTGRLLENPNITEYLNNAFGYSIIYPASWTKSSIGGDDTVMFKSEDDYFIQIIVQPNADNEIISDWYSEQFSIEVNQEDIISTDYWQGIMSEDGFILYLTDNNQEYIFIISYIPGAGDSFVYKNIYQVVIDSFKIGD